MYPDDPDDPDRDLIFTPFLVFHIYLSGFYQICPDCPDDPDRDLIFTPKMISLSRFLEKYPDDPDCPDRDLIFLSADFFSYMYATCIESIYMYTTCKQQLPSSDTGGVYKHEVG